MVRLEKPRQRPPELERELSEREREILRLVVRSFVATAGPVGSRYLAKRYRIGLSPASIRNTMSDLEEAGFLDHPYTSAGRIPTELGYRKFVDELMETTELTPSEKKLLKAELDRLVADPDGLLREGSRLLSRLSNLLGVVLTPNLATGVLERLDVVPLTSSRAMFVLSMEGGMIKTIVVEVDSDLSREALDRVIPLLNERLAGHTLEEIRRTYGSRIRDIDDEKTGIVRLILNEASQLFSDLSAGGRLRYAGAQNLLSQPEFQEPSDLKNFIEILEDEDHIIRLLEDRGIRIENALGRAIITIGSENTDEKAEKFSIITARYKMGETIGTVGVIGPTRMDYARVVALVEGMAALLSNKSDEPSD